MLPISVCIIAKNEENNIERCLSSLAPYDFEIIVIDTGSTDRTKELAAKYTDKIYDYEWIDDFSAARNFSLEKASNKWIFMMDCDEWIEEIDIEEFEYFRKHLPNDVGSISRRNYNGSVDAPTSTFIDRTERLFSKQLYNYKGIIHEQLTPKFQKEFETYLLNTTIGHSGYCISEEAKELKAKRNITLLLKQLESEPDNPYVYYQLGIGYKFMNDYENAYTYFSKGLEYDVDPSLAYVDNMVVEFGHTMLELGRFEEALSYEGIYEDFKESADFVYLMGLIYLKNERYEDALNEFLKAPNFDFANQDGANSYLAYYHIGYILAMAQEYDSALLYLQKCGDYEPALSLIKQIKQI